MEPAGSGAAFELAERLGATGIESGVFLTQDAEVVLGIDPSVRSGLRRRDVSAMDARDVSESHPRLAEVVSKASVGFALSLAGSSSKVVDALVSEYATLHLGPSRFPLWLRSRNVEQLRDWRKRWPELRLVHDTNLGDVSTGPERHAALLAESDIDAVRLPYPDWTGGLATLFHRFEVLGFAHRAVHDRMFDELIRMGVDGISSQHVDRLLEGFARNGLS